MNNSGLRRSFSGRRGRMEGYSSGQRGQTVNLLTNVYVGSNPTPSTTQDFRGTPVWFSERGGSSSMVELQPSKLIARVRFPSPAPDGDGWLHRCDTNAHIALVVERTLGKGEVISSNLIVGTKFAGQW